MIKKIKIFMRIGMRLRDHPSRICRIPQKYWLTYIHEKNTNTRIKITMKRICESFDDSSSFFIFFFAGLA